MASDQVIIVGAGPVGLGAALELARCGVKSVLVERHAGTSFHPKTRNFNTRTMEIARGWGKGVYDRFRAIDIPHGWKSPIRFLESATGAEFGLIESRGFEGPGPDVSPALPVMSSQDLFEEIMLDAARASGLVDVRFSTEVVRLIENGDRAVIEVEDRNTGARNTIEGAALVAADGAASLIRTELGIEMEGMKQLHRFVNCYFQADIEVHLGDRTGVLLFVSNSQANGVLQPLDAKGRWLCQINVPPEHWSLDYFTKERAADWVRAATGVPDLAVKVRSLGLWELNATVAQHLVQGRVVLCGDAAHQFPPTGGLGVNTGLQGMHNAMWKLALYVKGLAGWPLVESYHDERRGVSQAIVMQSLQNSANVARINAAAAAGSESGLSTDEAVIAARRYGNHLGVEFGAQYVSIAVIPDGTVPPKVEDGYADYSPSATPGCRAPHVWVTQAQSTLGLIGIGFTLLAGPKATELPAMVTAASVQFGVMLDSHVLDDAGLAAFGIHNDGAVLIRPDGHVAWRSTSAAKGGELTQVLSQILVR